MKIPFLAQRKTNWRERVSCQISHLIIECGNIRRVISSVQEVQAVAFVLCGFSMAPRYEVHTVLKPHLLF